MNTHIHNNVGAASEAAVVAQTELDLVNEAREKALKIAGGTEAAAAQSEISLAEKAKTLACKTWNSVKEFSQEIWEDKEGRKLLKDLSIALAVRLAFRHPLTAGIALGIVGHQVWQEIKTAKEAYTNN